MVSAYLLLPGRMSTPELLVHGAPQLFIGDIEVTLRRLQIRVTEKELNRSEDEAALSHRQAASAVDRASGDRCRRAALDSPVREHESASAPFRAPAGRVIPTPSGSYPGSHRSLRRIRTPSARGSVVASRAA